MKSLSAMMQQLDSLSHARGLDQFERGEIAGLVLVSEGGRDTLKLSVNQIGRLVELYRKHFGDAEPA